MCAALLRRPILRDDGAARGEVRDRPPPGPPRDFRRAAATLVLDVALDATARPLAPAAPRDHSPSIPHRLARSAAPPRRRHRPRQLAPPTDEQRRGPPRPPRSRRRVRLVTRTRGASSTLTAGDHPPARGGAARPRASPLSSTPSVPRSPTASPTQGRGSPSVALAPPAFLGRSRRRRPRSLGGPKHLIRSTAGRYLGACADAPRRRRDLPRARCAQIWRSPVGRRLRASNCHRSLDEHQAR